MKKFIVTIIGAMSLIMQPLTASAAGSFDEIFDWEEVYGTGYTYSHEFDKEEFKNYNTNIPSILVPGTISYAENRTVESVASKDLIIYPFNKAIEIANILGETEAVITLQNVDVISIEALDYIVFYSQVAGKTTKIQVEQTQDNKVVSSITIDAITAQNVGQDVRLNMQTESYYTKALFDLYFTNEIAIIKFNQTDNFGMNIKPSIKLDLSNLDLTKNLVFQSYNPQTNTLTPFNTTYEISRDGYLTFETNLANEIIITDRALTQK